MCAPLAQAKHHAIAKPWFALAIIKNPNHGLRFQIRKASHCLKQFVYCHFPPCQFPKPFPLAHHCKAAPSGGKVKPKPEFAHSIFMLNRGQHKPCFTNPLQTKFSNSGLPDHCNPFSIYSDMTSNNR